MVAVLSLSGYSLISEGRAVVYVVTMLLSVLWESLACEWRRNPGLITTEAEERLVRLTCEYDGTLVGQWPTN
jgi:hypothetical protein